jgi:hypothetical protein
MLKPVPGGAVSEHECVDIHHLDTSRVACAVCRRW